MKITDKSTIVYYHSNCWDGAAAAWAAWRHLSLDAQYVPINYKNYEKELYDTRGKNVFILDFSFPRPVLEKMHAEARSLRVLDHHLSAMEALEGLEYATFDMDKSGARLAWEYFHPGESVPLIIQVVEDRDLWRFAHPMTKPINAYLRMEKPSIVAVDEADMLIEEEGTQTILERGEAILSYIEKQVKDAVRSRFTVRFDGLEVECAGCSPDIASEVGQALAGVSRSDVGCCILLIPDGAVLSFRSLGDGCALNVAKKLAGGGHHHAAGANVNHEILQRVLVDKSWYPTAEVL